MIAFQPPAGMLEVAAYWAFTDFYGPSSFSEADSHQSFEDVLMQH